MNDLVDELNEHLKTLIKITTETWKFWEYNKSIIEVGFNNPILKWLKFSERDISLSKFIHSGISIS